MRTVPPPAVRRWQTGGLRSDRLQHAGVSFTLALGAARVSRRPAAAFAGTLALGVAKELWDGRSSRFDPVDLTADVVGAAAGAALGR